MSTESSQPRGRLFCRGGPLKGTTFEVALAATLGRLATNECKIDDASVAPQHARIRWDAETERYVIEDLGNPQETQVDGVKVEGARPLDRLHVITFGDVSFVFQQVAAEAPGLVETDSPKTQRLESVPTIPVGLMSMEGKAPTPRWRLEVEIQDEWHHYDLEEGENSVGRVSSDVVLPSREISRSHAVVVVNGREVRVRDLGSTNFTFLDGVRILVETRVPLGALLSFGPHQARITAEHGLD